MYNCHDDVTDYQNTQVTLPSAEQKEMRERRDANRQRLKAGLERDGAPKASDNQTQGSYAHRTMVQHPNKDYDIDDGVYFWKDDLKGPKGGDMSAADAKEMVRKALHDERFKNAPEVRTNCVRVYYDAGYHVDIPVYRKVKTKDFFGNEEVYFELASSDWKRANPVAVTDWFNAENERQSPDAANGRQLRRVTRLVKAFGRSRESWRPKNATGFMITTLLATGCYTPDATRDDKALYDSMVAMRDRLKWNLEIDHPTVKGDKLTRNKDDARARFLRDKLNWAIETLQVLFEAGCDRETALKAWDATFATDFFVSRLEKAEAAHERTSGSGVAAAAVLAGVAAGLTANILTKRAQCQEPDRPVDKRGGGRYG